MATYADWLRDKRTKGGWTRRDVAHAAGISEGAIRDYERGARMPSLEAALRICVALGLASIQIAALRDLTDGASELTMAVTRRQKQHVRDRTQLTRLRRQLQERDEQLTEVRERAGQVGLDLVEERKRNEAEARRKAQEHASKLAEEKRKRERAEALARKPQRLKLVMDDKLPGE